MSGQSRLHEYLSWAKQRIDEMDATLASLESELGQATADAKVKADQSLADMKKRRDEFQANVKAQAEAAEAALQTAKAQLETQWRGFEAQLNMYFEIAGKHMEQQQVTFRDVASAQAKAWREAVDQLRIEAAKVASARRTEVDAAIEQMKVAATEADARLDKLKQAGSQSWTSLSAALADSRKAFERANQQAWDALKRAL